MADLKSYYNFSNIGDFKFKSLIFSDSKQSFSVEFKDTTEIIRNDLKNEPEKKVEQKLLNLKKLMSKRELIESRKPLIHSKPVLLLTKNLNNFCLRENSKCKICSSYCKYSIKDLEKLKKNLIVDELSKHHHPKNRTILNKQRNKDQALEELIQHYKIVHKIFL